MPPRLGTGPRLLCALAPNLLEARSQSGLLAPVGELEEALVQRVVGHHPLLGDAVGSVVRVVVALAPAELLRAWVVGVREVGGDLGGAVLPDPGLGGAQALVGGVRLRSQGQ